MAIVRKSREYFISNSLPRGAVYKRFRAANRPDERTFQYVFNSVLMPEEKNDTATLSFAGHSKKASLKDVIARKDVYDDGYTRFVSPNLIPIGEGSVNNKENGNFELKNDEKSPGPGKYYGTNLSGDKGYHNFIGDGGIYMIDVPTDPCSTRYYTDDTTIVEKSFLIPKELLPVGKRLIWTIYFCASTYDVETWVDASILEDNGTANGKLAWSSSSDLYPPQGTSMDPFTTMCKGTVILDHLPTGLYANAYNEYHKHGDDDFISGRSCCYSGGPLNSSFLDMNDIILRIAYRIPPSSNTFTYNRSEVQIVSTSALTVIS